MLKDRLNAYLDGLSQHAPEGTVASHRYTLVPFVDECQRQGIIADELDTQWAAEYLANIPAHYKPVTIRGKISTLTSFIAYVRREHPEIIRWKIQSELEQQANGLISSRSNSEEPEWNEDMKAAVNRCLEHIRERAYGTRVHAVTEIIIATGCGLGTLRKLNLEDLQLDDRELELGISEAYAIGKNDPRITRTVTLPDECVRAVQIYLEYERIPTNNSDTAEPLFTTQHGRLSASTLRRSIQAMIDAACSDATSNNSGFTITQAGDEADSQLSPRDIRRYYYAQLIEE